MRALEKFSSRVYWEGHEEDLDVILSHVSDIDHDDSSRAYLKPDNVEDVACYLIGHKKALPKVFMRWDMDPLLLSQALVQAHRLEEASKFSNRTDIIACLVELWTVDECIANLQTDHGGFRKLFESLKDEDCAWLATVPELAHIYRQNPQESAKSSVQELVYRRLFMHVDFDPLVPPRFLASFLPMMMIYDSDSGNKQRQRVLHYAVQYLEHGNLQETSRHLAFLPWEELSLDLLERTAVALQDDESNPIWRRLDITKIQQEEALHCIPAKLLAIQALQQVRRLEDSLEEEKNQAKSLAIQALQKVRRLEHSLEQEKSRRRRLENEVARLKELLNVV